MNIKPMLARLANTIGCQDLAEQLILLQPSSSQHHDQEINLFVGYDSSPNSQTALDLTLCIAHQTRLITQKQVTVQVVYVLDEQSSLRANYSYSELAVNVATQLSGVYAINSAVPALTQTRCGLLLANAATASPEPSYFSTVHQYDRFELAEQILWQARTLASEWGDSFKAHLRFGCIATELRRVVQSETATFLFLGCDSSEHPLIQKLGQNFPCPVLGIPATTEEGKI